MEVNNPDVVAEVSGLVLAAVGVFIIEREFTKAAAFAFAGAALTYFGFMTDRPWASAAASG